LAAWSVFTLCAVCAVCYAANAGAPPSLNVDVPRLLLKEYHHRIQRAKVRRQQELEQLLQREGLAHRPRQGGLTGTTGCPGPVQVEELGICIHAMFDMRT